MTTAGGGDAGDGDGGDAGGGDDGVWQQRDADLSWREIDDEIIILDLQSAAYLRLNSAGRVLWQRLEDGATREQLAAVLVESFGLDVAHARADVAAFLTSCGEHGLLGPAST